VINENEFSRIENLGRMKSALDNIEQVSSMLVNRNLQDGIAKDSLSSARLFLKAAIESQQESSEMVLGVDDEE